MRGDSHEKNTLRFVHDAAVDSADRRVVLRPPADVCAGYFRIADAIRGALEMEPEDKQLRLHHMRKVIKEHNIYRWAGNLITELCEVRLDAPEAVQEKFRAIVTVA